MKKCRVLRRFEAYQVGEIVGFFDHVAAANAAKGNVQILGHIKDDPPSISEAQQREEAAERERKAAEAAAARPSPNAGPLGRMKVTFLRIVQAAGVTYNSGETATFPHDIAARLIVTGAARRAVEDGEEVEAAATADKESGEGVDYAAMSAPALRAAVGKITGQRPATKADAVDALVELGLWNGEPPKKPRRKAKA